VKIDISRRKNKTIKIKAEINKIETEGTKVQQKTGFLK
jgi:hypothetical protein